MVEGCVTAVVPAWNLGDELGAALDSIGRQERISRVVVVNNASEKPLDTSGADLLTLGHRVSIGAARNAGLELVRTPYVCFMDGDDILLPGSIDRLARLLDARADAVAAAGAIELWYPDLGDFMPSFYPPRIAWRLHTRPQVLALVNPALNVFPSVGGTVIRTDCARRAGAFPDLDYLETWCFGVALTLLGPAILDPHPAKLYRVEARDSLKTLRSGSVRAEWRGRAEIRAIVRRGRRSWRGHLLAAVLLPIHAAQVLLASGRKRPRQHRYLDTGLVAKP